jgi:REP element-mobilizing transposase RayT
MFFEANAIYHIYNRSNETVFYSRENYLFFLSKIRKNIFPVCNILAWVLMPNHFHLLVQATENSCKNTIEKHRPCTQLLSKNIGIVLSSYSQAINRQENRQGNLFSHKTKAKMLNELYPSSGSNRLTGNQPDYATNCFLYIHQNPVIAGLVSKLKDWEFSSFRDFAGLRNGKLVNKQLAFEFVDLDPEHFYEQSNRLVDDELLRKFFP